MYKIEALALRLQKTVKRPDRSEVHKFDSLANISRDPVAGQHWTWALNLGSRGGMMGVPCLLKITL